MIEVRITGYEIMKHDSHTFVPFVLEELKKVGIPVTGTLLFHKVSRGRLSWFQNHWGADLIFRWEE